MKFAFEWFQTITVCMVGFWLGTVVYKMVITYVKNKYDKNIYNGYVMFYIGVYGIVGAAFILNSIGISF